MQRDLQRPIPAEMVTNQIGVPIAPMPPPNKTVITPKFVLNVLRRWWKLSTMIGVVLAVVAGVISYYTYKPTYEATAYLRFREHYILSPTKVERGVFIVDQRELIKSPPILAEALAKPEISSLPIFVGMVDPMTWLRTKIVATAVSGSNLFTITLRDEHRESVAKVVNAVKEAYLAHLNTDTARRNDDILNLLTQEKDRKNGTIEQLKGRLKQMIKESSANGNLINPDGARAPAIAAFSMADFLKQQITGAEVEIVMKEAELGVLQQSLAPDGEIQIDPGDLELALDEHPEVRKIVQDRLDREEELAAIAAKAKPDSPALTRKREELKSLEEKILTARKKVGPKVTDDLLAEARRIRGKRIQEVRDELENAKRHKEILEQKLATTKKDAQIESATTLDIGLVQDELDRAQSTYKRIVDRMEEIKTESRTTGMVETLRDATEPKEAVDNGPVPRALMFGLVAFMLPFGGFFLWELRSRRVSDAEDFADVTSLRVVGEISTLPIRSRFLPSGHKRFEESLSRFEESIDYLRTAILIARQQRTVQSLVVCSAASREGKSTVAAHLASSLARGISGRVLLVDADMRRPHLHRLLDQDPENGLVDYLAGRCEFADVLRSSWVERLDFVAAGILDTPVGILLANDRFERFLRQAERTYEFIVIDVPPILPVSEGLIIAKCADGAIFCGLRDVSTVVNISRACDKLRAAGVNIFGAVFNGVPPREYGASGYYYYRIPSQQQQAITENVSTPS